VCVVALDLDHTVLDSKRRVPQAVRAAIRRVREAGAIVVLASGRSPSAMRTVVRELGPDTEFAICYGGAWIGDVGIQDGDSRPRFEEHRVPVPIAHNAVAAAQARGLDIGWYVGETVYLDSPSHFFTSELASTGEAAQYADFAGLPAPNKLLAVRHRDQDVAMLNDMIDELRGQCDATFIFDWLVELWPPGVSKATGLAEFCRALGIGLDRVAAVGDSENDLDMIREVGLGIAMGNAISAVKDAARWTTLSHDEAGVAAAIDRMFAEGLIVPAPGIAHR